ncbi:helix-turn-helix transcriptional regulator [Actinoplanes sp. NPDC051470]|uniref:helix-turn-helix domain-containing protein n=1 Tax=Actinoplanes sp. NPDC051470 TaxID=3157224 RepID=UPI003445292C
MAADFAEQLRRLRKERGLSLRELAREALQNHNYIHQLEQGKRTAPGPDVVERLDRALDAGGRLISAARGADSIRTLDDEPDAEIEALELVRRVTASDVSPETLDQLERAADRMAMAYATTPPDRLLPRVRRHLTYASSLLDARKTLAQHRRLIVVGGWLSLLRATLHIDLRQADAADAHLDTATSLAGQAEHTEIAAWALETQAWDVLTSGDYRRALSLSQRAQATAPAGSSAYMQATAQEGRAWARLGDRVQTGKVLTRLERMAGKRPEPDRPEHHYQYDPAKAHSYAATTLAWAGDPAAARVAREVLAELEVDGARPRRIASARLDLSLALLTSGSADEAAAEAQAAIGTGRIVPSNWWRATEVLTAVEDAGAPEAADLREVYELHRPTAG